MRKLKKNAGDGEGLRAELRLISRMKKLLLLGAILMGAATASQAGVHFGFSVGVPAVVITHPAPVCYAPPVVYQAPPPVYYQAPPPVYYAQPPVVYAPGPRVYVGFGPRWHGHDGHGWHHRW